MTVKNLESCQVIIAWFVFVMSSGCGESPKEAMSAVVEWPAVSVCAGPPRLLRSDSTINAAWPIACADEAGNAFVVWCQNTYDPERRWDPDNSLWTSHYAPGSGWTIPAALPANDEGALLINSTRLVPLPDGGAVCLWTVHREIAPGCSQERVWASQHFRAKGWQKAQPIDQDDKGFTQYDIDLSADPKGNAVAIWVKVIDVDRGPRQVRTNFYRAGTGWGAPEVIQETPWMAVTPVPEVYPYSLCFPHVCMGPEGTALAIWRGGTLAHQTIWASSYAPKSGWQKPSLIHPESLEGCNIPDLAMNQKGIAFAVWRQLSSTTLVWANRYERSTGWANAELIHKSDYLHAVIGCKVVVDYTGNAVVLWEEAPLPSQRFPYRRQKSDFCAKRYLAGKGWQEEDVIQTSAQGEGHDPDLLVGPQGKFYVIYARDDPARNRGFEQIVYRVCMPPGGWADPVFIDSNVEYYHLEPRAALDGRSMMIAVWEQKTLLGCYGRAEVAVRRFNPSAPESLCDD